MTPQAPESDSAVLKLLAAAKNSPPAACEDVEAADYDWNVPSRFTASELDNVGRMSEKAAVEIARELSSQLHEETPVRAVGPSQHYAGRLELLDPDSDNLPFCVTRADQSPCGLVLIPGELARSWVGKALGGSTADGAADREFSTLEAALLRDVVEAIVNAFSSQYRMVSDQTIECGRQASGSDGLGEVKSDDEYCVLSFGIGAQEGQPAISFVLSSDILGQAAGGGTVSQAGDASPEDSREKLLACVRQASVTATVSLMTTNLSLRDVMELEVGDVLIADKCVGQPLEVLVGGSVVLSGHPVSCDGQYALQITE